MVKSIKAMIIMDRLGLVNIIIIRLPNNKIKLRNAIEILLPAKV